MIYPFLFVYHIIMPKIDGFKPKFKRYCEHLFTYKINYYKHFNEACSLEQLYFNNINKFYYTIVNRLIQLNLIHNDVIIPSLFKLVVKDLTIRPFWNDKIQSLSDKLFLPSEDNIQESNDIIRT